MATDKEIEAAAKAIYETEYDAESYPWDRELAKGQYRHMARAALSAAEQVRASAWPTDEMVTAAEMKMPNLGRLQIRFLFETMMEAAPKANLS